MGSGQLMLKTECQELMLTYSRKCKNQPNRGVLRNGEYICSIYVCLWGQKEKD